MAQTKKMKKPSMPKAHKPAGGKTARGVKFGGKKGGMKKASAKKGAAGKMPFGAAKAPGARKTQPAQKKAMGGKMTIKKSRKKKK